VRINGEDAGVSDFRSSFGFVPQEDVMLRTMTVSEITHFYANMRLPPNFTDTQRSQVAETVIDVLGMSHVQHSAIGDEETRGTTPCIINLSRICFSLLPSTPNYRSTVATCVCPAR